MSEMNLFLYGVAVIVCVVSSIVMFLVQVYRISANEQAAATRSESRLRGFTLPSEPPLDEATITKI